MCLFVCHAVTQLTNPWTACLPRERGQISAPVWQGGTSHSVSMVISRCHSPQRRSEGFLTSVRKRGSLHCPSPQPVDAAAKALAMESPIQLHGRERERGANKRGLERRGMSGGHKEKGNKMKEPKFLDSSAWHVSLVLPYMVTARGANG